MQVLATVTQVQGRGEVRCNRKLVTMGRGRRSVSDVRKWTGRTCAGEVCLNHPVIREGGLGAGKRGSWLHGNGWDGVELIVVDSGAESLSRPYVI